MDPRHIWWMAEIYAANARIEAMKAANAHAIYIDHTPPYTEDDFRSEAAGLMHIAEAARNG